MATAAVSVDIGLFDRQIRLLGLEIQKKIASASLFVYGTADHVFAEILKNVILLGVTNVVIFRTAGSTYPTCLGADIRQGALDIGQDVKLTEVDGMDSVDPSAYTAFIRVGDSSPLSDFVNRCVSQNVPHINICGADDKLEMLILNKIAQQPIYSHGFVSPIASALVGAFCCEELVGIISDAQACSMKRYTIDAAEQTAACQVIP